MAQVSESQTRSVVEAFDGIAEVFEERLENDTTRRLRRQVYNTIHSLVPPGASLLDINCGTGIDTVALALEGYRILGLDISPKMIEQARNRAQRFGVRRVNFLVSSFEDLSLLPRRDFDLVLSNFGGLNCVLSLGFVAKEVASVIRPGGYFIAVVMPPISLWELVAGFAGLNPAFAFRRLQKDVLATGFGPPSFTVRYYSPRRFAGAFKRWFDVKHIRGFNVISPPPHATSFAAHHPQLAGWLEKLNERVAGLPLLRSAGDHSMIALQKKQLSL